MGSDRLEKAIASAQELELEPGEARVRASQLVPWVHAWSARSDPRPRVWWWGMGWGWAAAATVVLALWGLPAEEEPVLSWLGTDVAMIPSAACEVRVTRLDASGVDIAVEAGELAVRRFEGPERRVTVSAGQLLVEATGTVFTVGWREGRPFVETHQGIVRAITPNGEHALPAGLRLWDGEVVEGAPRVVLGEKPEVVDSPAQRLAALPAPELFRESTSPASAGGVRPPSPRTEGRSDSRREEHAQVPSAKELWRQARILRGQGRFEAAAETLARLSEIGGPTWTPVAMVELMRLYDGPLAKPTAVEELHRDFVRRYPDHRLRPEAWALYCRALGHLGETRPPECPAH